MTYAGWRGRLSAIASFFRRGEALAVVAVTLTLAIAYPSAKDAKFFQTIEGEALEWRFRVRGPEPPGSEVVIVAIDDRTLGELGRWPFSRSWLARGVETIMAGGARAVVFDLLFVGSEARSAIVQGGTRGSLADIDPSSAALEDTADQALIDAITRAGRVVIPFAFVFDREEANLFDPPPAIETAGYRVVLEDAARQARVPGHPAGILAPLTPLLAAGQPAHITVFLEADGSLRYAHPAIRYGDAYYPSLPVEAARLFLGLERDQAAVELGAGLRMGERFIRTGEEMAWAIDYAGPAGSFKTLSLIDVVKGSVARDSFRDRVVLIGATAVGLGDRFVTPYTPQLPGVEVFANVTAGILTRGFLQKSALTYGIDILAVVLCGLLAAALSQLRRPVVALLSVAGLVGVLCAANLYAFIAEQIWLNITFPGVAVLLAAGIVTLGRTLRESRLRAHAERRIESLSRYIPPLAAAHLQDSDALASPGRSQMAVVMFVDLVGFTQASETMMPLETADVMSRFHRCVERAAQEHGGVIDKFIGDAVLVVFGLPAGGPSDAVDALACGRRIAAQIVEWDAELRAGGRPGIACGIGLHFGPVLVAEVGGDAHGQITVAGDTVNVASRLESLTRSLSATIIASDAVMDVAQVSGAHEVTEGFEALPVRQVRGRERPIGIWAWSVSATAGSPG